MTNIAEMAWIKGIMHEAERTLIHKLWNIFQALFFKKDKKLCFILDSISSTILWNSEFICSPSQNKNVTQLRTMPLKLCQKRFYFALKPNCHLTVICCKMSKNHHTENMTSNTREQSFHIALASCTDKRIWNIKYVCLNYSRPCIACIACKIFESEKHILNRYT